MNQIILQGISKEELIREITTSVLSGIEIPQPAAPTPPLMDKKQAAAYLNISLRTLDMITAATHLQFSRIGGSVRFKQSDLDAYISKSTVRAKRL